MNDNKTLNHDQSSEVKLFRTLWNHTHDNMFIVAKNQNNEFIIESVNRAQEKTFNLETGQINGKKLLDVLGQKTATYIIERYNCCIEENKAVTYEEQATIDGSGPRYWLTTILPEINEVTGKIRILGISREITSLKRINEELEKKVQQRTSELELMAYTDSLTGIYNRRFFFKQAEYLLSQSMRDKSKLCVMMLDLDHLKQINDEKGHQSGDEILICVAKSLKNNLREVDVICRYGGDEFIVVLPNITATQAEVAAKRIAKEIESLSATLSIAIIQKQNQNTIELLIANADELLYRVKDIGRNSIMLG